MDLSTGKKGAASELLASAWLISKGYEVFRNVSQDGDIDIVSLKDGQIDYWDVKSVGKGSPHRLKKLQIDKGIRMLAVSPEGECFPDYITEPPFEEQDAICKQCFKSFRKTKREHFFCDRLCRMESWKRNQSPSRMDGTC